MTFVHALLHSQSKNTHRGAGKALAATHGAEYHSSYDASTKKQAHTVHVLKAKSPEHAEEIRKKLEKHHDINHAHVSNEHGHILKEEVSKTKKTFEEFLGEGLATPDAMARHAKKAEHHLAKFNHHSNALKKPGLSDAQKEHHKKAVMAHSTAMAHHDSAAKGHNFAISAKEGAIASHHADSYKD